MFVYVDLPSELDIQMLMYVDFPRFVTSELVHSDNELVSIVRNAPLG